MGGTPVNPGFEVKLADGSVVKAENVEEAFKTVAKMKEDTSAALREERRAREEMETRLNQLQMEVAQRNQPPPPDDRGFNRERYFRLVGEDPIMAQNYLDAARFGIADPALVPGYFQNTVQKVSALEGETIAAKFVNSHPDFPGGVKEAELLTEEVIRLQQTGHPLNMGTLELAWRNMVETERIVPLEPPEETPETNPSLGGGGASALDAEVARVEDEVLQGKMSTADLEKYLRSKGLFG